MEVTQTKEQEDINTLLNTIIRVAEYVPFTTALGPHHQGEGRIAFWVQGCSQRCKGCISPEWRDYTGGVDMKVIDILSRVGQTPSSEDETILRGRSGITISGGEPLDQIDGILALLKIIHIIDPSFHVILFSGKTFEQIALLQRYNDLLRHVDILISDPYVEELNNEIGLRGSANQRVWAKRYTDTSTEYVPIGELTHEELKNRPLDGFDYKNGPRVVDVRETTIDKESIILVGVPTNEQRERFDSVLQSINEQIIASHSL
jgi:anaerobic ribonucleoside-triphosphate reductase activating protein